MKYQLTNLINSLSKEEIRNLKIYSFRFRAKDDTKKMMELFEFIKQKEYDEYDEGLVKLLFGSTTKNAYYQLKNRLIKEIEDSFLMLYKNKGEDYAVMRQLQLARIFSDKGEYIKSKIYLRKAEKLSMNIQDKMLQYIIYNQWLDLELIMPSEKGNIKEIVRKATECIDQTAVELKTKVLITSIKDDLFKSNNSHKSSQSVIKILDNTVNKLKMSEEYKNSATLRIQVSDSVKHVLLVKKHYYELVEFLEAELIKFREDLLFANENKEQEVRYISWLINALLRIKKIDKVNNRINELENLLSQPENQKLAKKHKWLLFQCRLVAMVYSGETKAAIALLSDLEGQQEKVPHYPFLVLLNLGLLHYYENNFEGALDYLTGIIADDSFKKFAPPLQLTVIIIELIIRIEKKDYYYVLSRYKSMKRKYYNYLVKEEYSRDKLFLELLKNIVSEKLDLGAPKKLKTKIRQFIRNSPPFEPGSNEALSYQLWLQAYLEKRNYYELVLDNINSEK